MRVREGALPLPVGALDKEVFAPVFALRSFQVHVPAPSTRANKHSDTIFIHVHTNELSINLTKRLAFRPVVAGAFHFSAKNWVSNYGASNCAF